MKPPICHLCRRRFEPSRGSGLVTFRKTDSDRLWEERRREEPIRGHPPYMQWFCEDHYRAAGALKHLTLAEAMGELSEPGPGPEGRHA